MNLQDPTHPRKNEEMRPQISQMNADDDRARVARASRVLVKAPRLHEDTRREELLRLEQRCRTAISNFDRIGAKQTLFDVAEELVVLAAMDAQPAPRPSTLAPQTS